MPHSPEKPLETAPDPREKKTEIAPQPFNVTDAKANMNAFLDNKKVPANRDFRFVTSADADFKELLAQVKFNDPKSKDLPLRAPEKSVARMALLTVNDQQGVFALDINGNMLGYAD